MTSLEDRTVCGPGSGEGAIEDERRHTFLYILFANSLPFCRWPPFAHEINLEYSNVFEGL